MKKTLVLGASEKTDRYANIAVRRLQDKDVPVVAHGYKEGSINGTPIITDFPNASEGIHTVTLYLSAKNQKQYYEDIVELKPERVIFNPGTYNDELEVLLKDNNISFEHACTLVMLSADTY